MIPRFRTARRGSGSAVGAALVLLLVLLVLIVAACTVSTTTPFPGGRTVRPGESGSGSGPGDTAGPDATSVAIDSNLLAVLPREVGGVPVVESPEGDSDALADDVLPTIATSAVGAVAVDGPAQNFAYALVVKLRPNALTDDTYRDWRDSFDSGVCLGDSQVVGNASSTINGNMVFVGTCASGLRTYHVWLKDRSILVSVSAGGDRAFGLLMMQNLRK